MSGSLDISLPGYREPFFSQVSGALAARNTVKSGTFGVIFPNGFTYSQTISPSGFTSKNRPFAPSQIRVFPFDSRCALLM